jgi:hypothetical protein
VTSLPAISSPAARAFAILFFAEMAFSPVVAGAALLVPVAADWGAYKYVPATVWVLILVQCLITFRWRGLWFLLGPPIAFVAIETVLVSAPAVPKRTVQAEPIRPEGQNATKAGTENTIKPTSGPEPPLVTPNPNGTLTVQKQPTHPTTPGEREQKGLRIPPQVIAPMNPSR